MFRYQSGNWALPGGHSAVLPACWTLGPRIDDLLRDAARYRWLKETYYDETFAGLYDSPVDGGVNSEQFDADIDAEVALEKGP